MIINQDQNQLTLIQAMRFPLIVMVMFVHSLGFEYYHAELSLNGWAVYHFVSEMISHNLCGMAVSCFYLFSGYLFFRGIEDSQISWDWFAAKWRRRVNTLLIPYILWNLLAIIILWIKGLLFGLAGFPSDETINMSLTEWLWLGPADYPLYYLRDLMIMTLVTPFLYVFIRKLKWLSLGMLLCLYLIPTGISIPGPFALFYFGVGAWLCIWKISYSEIFIPLRVPSYIVSFVLLIIATLVNATDYHWLIIRFLYPACILALMNIISRCIMKDSVGQHLCSLSASVFFIYAIHEILILGWTKGLYLRLLGTGLVGTWCRYFLVPITVLGICFLLYKLMSKYTSKTFAILNGQRTR